MIRFRFDEKKAVQAAAAFLKRNGGRLNSTKLIKLLYLLDREALLASARPVTGDRFVSMDHGPVVSKIYVRISEGPQLEPKQTWHQFVVPDSRYVVRLEGEPGDDELSEAELELVEKIDSEHKTRTYGQMIDWCHENLPEWTDPQGTSVDIWPDDILRHIGHWSEEEIAEWEEDIRQRDRLRGSAAA